MLLELAIGDAFGSRFEMAPKRTVQLYNNGEDYGGKTGTYTDDTQLSIALAEIIIDDIDFTISNIAQKFVEVFQRDPRKGYSRRMYQALSQAKDGREFASLIEPTSERSGAAMRAAPLGVFSTVDEVLEKSKIQAQVTHNSIMGVLSSHVAALMAHYFLYDLGKKADVGKFVCNYVGMDQFFDSDWDQETVPNYGISCVLAAITAIKRSSSFKKLLVNCVAFTGDVDTVAAIAMGAASSCKEMKDDIPFELYYKLENGTYGRDYLRELDKKLLAKVAR